MTKSMSVSDARRYFEEHEVKRAAIRTRLQTDFVNPTVSMVFDHLYFFVEPGSSIICGKNPYGTVCFNMVEEISISESSSSDYDLEMNLSCGALGCQVSQTDFVLLVKI